MLVAPSIPTPVRPARRSLGDLTPNCANNSSPAAPLSQKSGAYKNFNKAKPTREVQPKPQPTREDASIFGHTGVLESQRGPTPPDAQAFGESGILQSDRGATPLAFKTEGRTAAREADDVAAFLRTHTDGVLFAGRVTCTTTGHQMPAVRARPPRGRLQFDALSRALASPLLLSHKPEPAISRVLSPPARRTSRSSSRTGAASATARPARPSSPRRPRRRPKALTRRSRPSPAARFSRRAALRLTSPRLTRPAASPRRSCSSSTGRGCPSKRRRRPRT